MDPFSITATVVGLTAQCVQAAKGLNDFRAKYQEAHLTILSICSETTVISTFLTQLQAMMLGNSEALQSRLTSNSALERTFDTVLTSCVLIFTVLEDEVSKLNVDDNKPGFRAKARYLWNEETMQSLLGQIRGQQTALNMLLQLLQMESVTETHAKLDAHERLLVKMTNQTRDLRRSRPYIQAPASIYEVSFETRTLHLGDDNSTTGRTAFDFDREILNTGPYRRVKATKKRSEAVIETGQLSEPTGQTQKPRKSDEYDQFVGDMEAELQKPLYYYTEQELMEMIQNEKLSKSLTEEFHSTISLFENKPREHLARRFIAWYLFYTSLENDIFRDPHWAAEQVRQAYARWR